PVAPVGTAGPNGILTANAVPPDVAGYRDRYRENKGENRMKNTMLAAVAACALAMSAPAFAADGSTTFGGATVTDGVATLVANTGNTPTADDFSGVTVPVSSGLTFGQIPHLQAA